MTGSKNIPKDLQAMSNILRDFGITDYESGVENHMLDFANRYITTLIEDALLYSSHAKKKSIDVEDVKLAIELQQDKYYTCPPSREITATMARQRNSVQLPTIRSSAGLRLPPDRHSLIACNFLLKCAVKKARAMHATSRVNISNVTPTSQIVPRAAFKPLQNQIVKFSEVNKVTPPTAILTSMPVTTSVPSNTVSVPSQILMPTIGISNNEVKLSNDVNSSKRSHEEDDDYDN